MGWTSTYNTFKDNKDFYNHMLANQYAGRATVIDFAIVGNQIYQLVKTEKETFIGLIVIERHNGEIYWKQFDESCFPRWFNCPARLLKASTCTTGSAQEWRTACEKTRTEKRNGNDLISQIKRLQRGARVQMQSGNVITFEFPHNRARFAGRLESENGQQNQLFAFSYKQVEKIL